MKTEAHLEHSTQEEQTREATEMHWHASMIGDTNPGTISTERILRRSN